MEAEDLAVAAVVVEDNLFITYPIYYSLLFKKSQNEKNHYTICSRINGEHSKIPRHI
jgi:hypothetical protein